jgi:hypothetical protein
MMMNMFCNSLSTVAHLLISVYPSQLPAYSSRLPSHLLSGNNSAFRERQRENNFLHIFAEAGCFVKAEHFNTVAYFVSHQKQKKGYFHINTI